MRCAEVVKPFLENGQTGANFKKHLIVLLAALCTLGLGSLKAPGADLAAGQAQLGTNKIIAGDAFNSLEYSIGYTGPPNVRFARVISDFFLASTDTNAQPTNIWIGFVITDIDYSGSAAPGSFSKTFTTNSNDGILFVPADLFEADYFLVHHTYLDILQSDAGTDNNTQINPANDTWIGTNIVHVTSNPVMGAGQWHWLNPMPQENNLTGVAYGSGKYVAVDDTGTILISSNALEWTLVSADGSASIRNVIYAAGKFWAVRSTTSSQVREILTSPDGETWTKSPLPLVGLNSVYYEASPIMYANRRLILTGPLIYTIGSGASSWSFWRSSDGQDWTLETGPHLTSLAFGNGVFVGANVFLYASATTEEWLSTDATSGALAVAFGAGQFIAVGDTGNIQSSVDGLRWMSQQPPTTERLNCVAYLNGRFIAAGKSGTILISANGHDWTRAASGTSWALSGIAYGPEGYIVVGENGTILTSTDAMNWAVRTHAPSEPLLAAASGGGTRVAVGWYGQILTSTNQTNWLNLDSGTYDPLLDVAYGDGQFIAVGGEGTILSSSNGLDWVQQPAVLGNPISRVFFAHNTFLAAADGVVLHSSDGLGWVPYSLPGRTNLVTGMCYASNRFVLVCENGRLFESPDGSAWTSFGPTVPGRPRSIAFGGDKFVLATDYGGWFTNATGFSWSSVTTDFQPEEVRFIDGVFVAVGWGGGVATSTNGTTWHRRETGTRQNLYGIGWDSRMFAVGDGATIIESSEWRPPVALLAMASASSPRLTLYATPGTRYVLESSDDLLTWRSVTELDVSGELDLSSFVQPNAVSRFFRARFLGAIDPASGAGAVNAPTWGATPPTSLANSILTLVPIDQSGNHTISLFRNGNYSASYNDGTTESGTWSYSTEQQVGTVVLVPWNAYPPMSVYLKFDLTRAGGGYTSDALYLGTFTISPFPP